MMPGGPADVGSVEAVGIAEVACATDGDSSAVTIAPTANILLNKGASLKSLEI